ncbi:endolytic transglycosylase MltG [Streptomyces sp. A7024]|uniref:Endolytic murein transglycosylase n=1 Tax=Streptomyces coryli TaxID=1128680 RepID=A0A6G4TTF8_9ACTN|nr:endolytic transglycosylase MltG [Streptomyces coryli]NGN63062.1 endolytic transglycosylase MltG [Streptomyces coryli]
MTEYGRGSGSEPWHPEDPLFGTGQHWGATHPGHGQAPYGGGQQYQQPAQAQWGGHPQQGGYPYGGQQQPGYDPGYGVGHPPQQPSWDTTGGLPAVDPYAHPPQPAAEPDYYGSPDAYPPPRPRPRGQERRRPEPGRRPPEREHSFFAEDDDVLGDDDPTPRRRRGGPPPGGPGGPRGRGPRGPRGRGPAETKRRNGAACLIVALVLLGLVGGIGYFGYSFVSDKFASAPDFEGSGHGMVEVEVPEGASITDIGNKLKTAGVVKSVDGFVQAAGDNDKASSIQPGVYTLKKEMSAAAAIEMMTDPKTFNALIIPEGWRATRVYEKIDSHLGLAEGTTKKAAEKGDLGLPSWAKGNPEGFLYPSRYSASKGTKPETVLKQMVKRANAEYTRDNIVNGAKKLNRTPYEILTIASLVQAEGGNKEEFEKVATVIYNRLKPGNTETNGKLDMDSTINYAKGQSNLDISTKDTQFDSPYNTYLHAGLPPGPIDNPSPEAIKAALNPAKGDWMYFVTVRPGVTKFTASKAEHDKNVAEFNRYQREHSD